MSIVDLFDLPAHGTRHTGHATLSIAHEESVGERGVRLFKDVTLLFMPLIFVGITIWISLHTLLHPNTRSGTHPELLNEMR